MSSMHAIPWWSAAGLLFAALTLAATPAHPTPGDPAAMSAKLSEWKVDLSQPTITAGIVTFTVTNTGSVRHAFEVEGQGIEEETKVIQPGSSATLKLTLKPGNYDVYCPVGGDSHKHLGMETHLSVVSAKGASASGHSAEAAHESADHEVKEAAPRIEAIGVKGAGPVIQILPGPFPFPDSAALILRQFGDEREGLEAQVKAPRTRSKSCSSTSSPDQASPSWMRRVGSRLSIGRSPTLKPAN